MRFRLTTTMFLLATMMVMSSGAAMAADPIICADAAGIRYCIDLGIE